MVAGKQVILTYQGLEKLETELNFLKSVKRKEVAEKIKQALAFGDISENSEYDEAKNEQAQVEIRVVQVENMLKNAKVIDDDDIHTDKVGLGCKVKVLDMEFNEEMIYTIVGSTEADPSHGMISDESPVGAALLGQKRGKVVDVSVPQGILKFKIVAITK